MTLARLDEVLADAVAGGRGVGAFNVIQLEHAEALVDAAERTGLPVVLQISENAVRYHGSLAPIALATRTIAQRATVPCVLHLDHAVSEPLVDEAVALGFTSVMFDGSRLGDEANRTATRRVVQRCHAAGVSVEAELGEIGGKDGVHAPGVRTDPADAAQFVADCGVDALAVAVGSSHAMTSRTAELDLELIAAIHRAGAGTARAARRLRCAGRRPGGRRPRRNDEGQHRHAPEQRVHHGVAPAPCRRPRGGRHPAVPGYCT